jgi:thiosulfate reductase cytochrome b subunit
MAHRVDTRQSAPRGHTRWVRSCHWIMALSVLTLAFSGFVILMSHPRLYWGVAGNDLMPAWLELPISRNYRNPGWDNSFAFFAQTGSPISESRKYHMFNQNSWGRSLHFLAAWFLAITVALYAIGGIVSGHFWHHLLPRSGERSPWVLWRDFVSHLSFRFPLAAGGPPYGILQKWTYAGVVFVALPLMIITGFAMSPAITVAYPLLSGMFGGSQSARSIHFLVFTGLMLFVIVHVLMVVLSGFRRQMRAMTLGN